MDGKKLEGFWRAHQVPLAGVKKNPGQLKMLEEWLRGYGPEDLFNEDGSPVSKLKELTPTGPRRMGANPHANGGLIKRALRLPDLPADGSIIVDSSGKRFAREDMNHSPFALEIARVGGMRRRKQRHAPE